MGYACPTCSMKSSITSPLLKNEKSGELVCKTNPQHRFKVDGSGFLKALPEL